jgi:hypothetical protein
MISLWAWIGLAEKPSADILHPKPFAGLGLCGLMETTSYAGMVGETGGSACPCTEKAAQTATHKVGKM